MKISDCMKTRVVSLPATATVADAADIFVTEHVGLLPIVDKGSHLIGVIGLRDLLKLELPDFVNLVYDVDFVHDFGAVENTRPSKEELAQPLTTLMSEAVSVEESCKLLRAYALMLKHDVQDLPVVSSEGKLAGLASRVDVGAAILSLWKTIGKKPP